MRADLPSVRPRGNVGGGVAPEGGTEKRGEARCGQRKREDVGAAGKSGPGFSKEQGWRKWPPESGSWPGTHSEVLVLLTINTFTDPNLVRQGHSVTVMGQILPLSCPNAGKSGRTVQATSPTLPFQQTASGCCFLE